MGDVGSARYEPALLPPCPTIRGLSYSNCQEIHPLHFRNLALQGLISGGAFEGKALCSYHNSHFEFLTDTCQSTHIIPADIRDGRKALTQGRWLHLFHCNLGTETSVIQGREHYEIKWLSDYYGLAVTCQNHGCVLLCKFGYVSTNNRHFTLITDTSTTLQSDILCISSYNSRTSNSSLAWSVHELREQTTQLIIVLHLNLFGLGLCSLMTPRLSKDIQCHVWPYIFLNLQITRSDIRPHIKSAVSLVIVCGHFNLPQGFVWVCMG